MIVANINWWNILRHHKLVLYYEVRTSWSILSIIRICVRTCLYSEYFPHNSVLSYFCDIPCPYDFGHSLVGSKIIQHANEFRYELTCTILILYLYNCRITKHPTITPRLLSSDMERAKIFLNTNSFRTRKFVSKLSRKLNTLRSQLRNDRSQRDTEYHRNTKGHYSEENISNIDMF